MRLFVIGYDATWVRLGVRALPFSHQRLLGQPVSSHVIAVDDKTALMSVAGASTSPDPNPNCLSVVQCDVSDANFLRYLWEKSAASKIALVFPAAAHSLRGARGAGSFNAATVGNQCTGSAQFAIATMHQFVASTSQAIHLSRESNCAIDLFVAADDERDDFTKLIVRACEEMVESTERGSVIHYGYDE